MTWHARTLDDLLDRAALHDLLTGLAQRLDAKDFDGLAEVYTADATLRTPDGPVRGADLIIDVARRNHENFARTQHFVSGITIERDGADATVGADVLAVFALGPGLPLAQRLFGSRYEVRAVRTAEGWRLREHTIVPLWTHVAEEPAAR